MIVPRVPSQVPYVVFLPMYLFYVRVNRKYTVIASSEQRQSYKNDFNAEYSEYRGLHARIEGITRQFTILDAELKQLQQGTDKYKVHSTHIHTNPCPYSPH